MKKKLWSLLTILVSAVFILSGCGAQAEQGENKSLSSNPAVEQNVSDESLPEGYIESVSQVPPFSGEPFVAIRDNEPDFKPSDLTAKCFEEYAPLDRLGRCGITVACVGLEIMPTEERGAIGQVKPTGWQTVKYDNVDGKYLYNRCHLIGFQLTGENANERNLITGTRYLNIEGMLPFENMIADYVKETENHVIYRVTPVFDGDNLLASGVQMEAKSVEDNGKGVCFNVFAYNVQPDIIIDYSNGSSRLATDEKNENSSVSTNYSTEYIINKNTKKFHKTDCGSVGDIKSENKATVKKSREELINNGFTPCKSCNP